MHRRRGRRGVRLPAAFALAATVAATSACGGLDQTRLLGSDTGGSVTTLGFGLQDDIASTRVDEFRKKFPDVDLRVNEGAFDVQQFLSAVASGRPPDLVYLEREGVGSYAHRGALQPLTKCVERAGIDMSDYRDFAVGQVTVDGEIYAIPEFTILQVVLINNKAAADVGVRPEDIDLSDPAGLAALGERMTKREGGKLTRLGFHPKIPDFYPLWVAAGGGRILSDDGKTVEIDSAPAREALAYGKRVFDAAGGYPVAKSFNDSWDFFGEKNEFATDQVGIMPMENWYLNVLAEASPDAPITVRAFEDREGNPISWAGGSSWAIPKGAKHFDQACDFIATMTAADTWVAAAKARAAAREKEKLPFTGIYTANKIADQRIFSEVYRPSGTKWVDDAVKVVLSLQDSARSMPPSPAGAEVKTEWQAAANRVLLNGDDPADVLGEAARQGQAAIDRTNAGR
jgi:multiple sugar transport system substrate-binding protein